MSGYTNIQATSIKIYASTFVLLWCAFLNNSWAETDKVYTVGVVPQFETRRLHGIWRPILEQLENDTGLKFKLRGSPTIPAFEKEFLAAKFDFAYMDPYHLVWSHETVGYVPLVRDHGKNLKQISVSIR